MRALFLPFLLLGTLLVAHAPSASGEAVPVAEGVVLPFQGGDSFSWTLPAEDYIFILVTSEEGAHVDGRDMGTKFADRTLRLPPHAGTSSSVPFSEGQTRSVEILEGSGRLVMARIDFVRNIPMAGPAAHVNASGELAPGACRAYLYDTTRMWAPALVRGTGAGVRFSVTDEYLQPVVEGEGSLQHAMDPDEVAWVLLHACNPGDAPRAFLVEGFYPAPEGTPLPKREAPGPGLFLVAVAACAALRTRPRR